MKFLVVNYYWPPSGGPAVQRWLAFTKRLSAAGFEPMVLTVDPARATYPFRDSTLEAEVPASVRVHRTPTREIFNFYRKTVGQGTVPASAFANEGKPSPAKKIARFIRGNFFIPDPRRAWNRFALPVAERLIEQEELSIVVTAGPPHSTHLQGLRLKKRHPRLIWLADIHDAWTDISYYKQFYHTPPARWLDQRYERRVLERADRLLTVSAALKERLAAKSPAIEPEKITILRMGYDEQLFEGAAPPRLEASTFRVTYVGTIASFYQPETFFEALAALRQARPQLPFEFRVAGVVDQQVRQSLARAGLEACSSLLGYVPHGKAVEEMRSAHLLFLVGPQFEHDYGHLPGKLYEYLAARRPIVHLGDPQNETARIIDECRAGASFRRGHSEALVGYLLWWADAFLEGRSLALPPTDAYRRYSRAHEATRLGRTLQALSPAQ